METIHKLAGVQDASDLQASSHERPSQAHLIPDRPPIPGGDSNHNGFTHHDNKSDGALSHRASRATLPLNRRPSHKSFRSTRSNRSSHKETAVHDDNAPPVPALPRPSIGARSVATTNTTAGEAEDDFVWGPQHPCFPHPNPHCSPDSDEARNTRVIRVKRDWLASGDLYPQYANLYPEILDPLVTDSDFRYLISNINSRCKSMFSPFTTRAWVDCVVGALTGYVWDDLGFTGPKREEKAMEGFLEGWNEERAVKGKDVRVVQLRRTGFMTLDFVVPNPGIDGVGEEQDWDE